MPTSPYWADVQVEVAFTSGYSTAAASRVWTDVSAYVEAQDGITINFGRQDERSQADANTLSLTLDNRDGRFTPNRTTGAYYPNVKLYRPIRVTATPPGGAASQRFVGYVTQWNVEWPEGTDAHAVCQVSASSRLQRLGLADQRRSVIEETYAVDGPVVLFTLGDAEGSTSAAESSGYGRPAATSVGSGTAVVFGTATGPPTDGLAAAQFSAGQYLASTFSAITGGAGLSLECFVLTSSSGGGDGIVRFGCMNLRIGAGGGAVAEMYEPTSGVSATTFASSAVVADGTTHHLAATWDGATLRLYVDGVLDTSTASGTAPAGPSLFWIGQADNSTQPLTGVVAHAAGYTSALSAGSVADHSTAGRTGFASESVAARLARFAAWARLPSAEATSSGTNRTVLISEPTGSSIVDLMRQLESTEQGVLYDARDGTLTLLGASGRYTASSAFTLDMQAQRVGSDYAPVHDPSSVVNDATVTQAGDAGASARVVNTTSRDDYGTATASEEIVGTDDDDALSLASWLVYRYKNPTSRVPNITVNVAEHVGATPSPDTLLTANIGTLFTVSNRASQDESTSADLFVEGYTETITPAAHSLSFNVSSATVDQSVLVLGDATRGAIGTYPLAY